VVVDVDGDLGGGRGIEHSKARIKRVEPLPSTRGICRLLGACGIGDRDG
jgi:hypothetical protein